MFVRQVVREMLVGAMLWCLACSTPTSNYERTSYTINNGTSLRILPLGDSITHGFAEATQNSYRKYLECMLYIGGNGVQYIGSQRAGDWPDNAHDGFDGRRIDEIATLGNPEITGTPVPNVVLVHVGTNDMIQNFDVADAPARLGTLVDQINAANPTGLILIAHIIPSNNSDINERIKAYNSALPAVMKPKIDAGKPIRLLSMASVKATDTIDGIHPNEVGYLAMAYEWFPAIVKAEQEGLIVATTGNFTNGGPSSLPLSSSHCSASTKRSVVKNA